MPVFEYPHRGHEIRRNAVMLDTNVLVDAFGTEDNPDHRLAAQYLLFESEHQFLIPNVVIAEAWGMLARKSSPAHAVEMLTWLSTPGSNTVVLGPKTELNQELVIIRDLRVDYVDAAVAKLATLVSTECKLKPRLQVATRDFRDFNRVLRHESVHITLLDYTELDWV